MDQYIQASWYVRLYDEKYWEVITTVKQGQLLYLVPADMLQRKLVALTNFFH